MKRTAIFSVGGFIFLLVVLNFFLPGIYVAQAGVAETGTLTSTPTLTVTTTKTVTVTATATPGCNAITAGAFTVSGTYLDFYITNQNPVPVYLTYTNLVWTELDELDTNAYTDYFSLNGYKYDNTNDSSSPTSYDSTGNTNLSVPAGGSSLWRVRFRNIDTVYGITHTVGPFHLDMVFDSVCPIHAEIPLVQAWIIKPDNNQVISDINQTKFEMGANDTGVGNMNGDGIDLVHYAVFDAGGNLVTDSAALDVMPPYCVWGAQSPCPLMSLVDWNSLPNGTYTLIAWGHSAVTFSWSLPAQVTFTLQRYPPTETPTVTPTSTMTATSVSTRFPTQTPTPFPPGTGTPTPTTSQTPKPTKTPANLPTSTPRPTRTP